MSELLMDMPKSLKILIGIFLFILFGLFGLFLQNKSDTDTITLNNGYTLNVRDYEGSKDINVNNVIKSFGDDYEDAIAMIVNNALESKNITYPEALQERMMSHEEFSSMSPNSNFVVIKIPVKNNLDFEKLAEDIEKSEKRIIITEEISDNMMYAVNNTYIHMKKDYTQIMSVPEIYEIRENKGVVAEFKETTNENVSLILENKEGGIK